MSMKTSPHFIYKIINPINNLPFYVGRTYTPAVRFNDHCAGNSCSATKETFELIIAAGKKPIFVIVEECSFEDVRDREFYWINKLIDEGFELVNVRTISRADKFILKFENNVKPRKFA